VFLDEASMATEPLSSDYSQIADWVDQSSHVAIIGDHKQLPPVIISEEAQAGGLATSMFERLIHEHSRSGLELCIPRSLLYRYTFDNARHSISNAPSDIRISSSSILLIASQGWYHSI
jgi:hypothetical protein